MVETEYVPKVSLNALNIAAVIWALSAVSVERKIRI
jgi:hypothetical protein